MQCQQVQLSVHACAMEAWKACNGTSFLAHTSFSLTHDHRNIHLNRRTCSWHPWKPGGMPFCWCAQHSTRNAPCMHWHKPL